MTLPRISVARLEHNPERRGNLDREAPLNCLAKILLKLFDIVALRGAAWDRGDSSSASCTTTLIFISSSESDRRARSPTRPPARSLPPRPGGWRGPGARALV